MWRLDLDARPRPRVAPRRRASRPRRSARRSPTVLCVRFAVVADASDDDARTRRRSGSTRCTLVATSASTGKQVAAIEDGVEQRALAPLDVAAATTTSCCWFHCSASARDALTQVGAAPLAQRRVHPVGQPQHLRRRAGCVTAAARRGWLAGSAVAGRGSTDRIASISSVTVELAPHHLERLLHDPRQPRLVGAAPGVVAPGRPAARSVARRSRWLRAATAPTDERGSSWAVSATHVVEQIVRQAQLAGGDGVRHLQQPQPVQRRVELDLLER